MDKHSTLEKPISLFFALNIIFSIYLISVDFFSASLLFVFSVIAFVIDKRKNKHKILNLSGFKIRVDVFEQILSLVPFAVKITDLEGNDLASNYGKMTSSLGVVIDEFHLQDSRIIKVKIDNKIFHFFAYKGRIADENNKLVAYLSVELVIDDILLFLSNEIVKNAGKNENILTAFDNLNDSLALYEVENGKVGKIFAANPSFYNLISPNTANTDILELFDVSERKRVNIIFDNLNGTQTLFETLMIDDSGSFPVEINANIVTINTKSLLNLSIRDISSRKENIKKRDRARILKIKESERIQKIQVLHLTLNKVNEIIVSLKAALNEIIGRHNEMREELDVISHLQNNIIDSINEIIHFYSQTDIKTMVNIGELMDNIKNVIFRRSMLNNSTINFEQKGNISSIYCDKNALKAVLITLFRNSLEHINFIKGSNFYGQVNVKLEDLNDDSVLLSIEDNGGGIDEEYLKRSFDAFYTTHSGRAGLGLSACKVLVEDLLFGEIMAMNVDDGFRVEITLPKAG